MDDLPSGVTDVRRRFAGHLQNLAHTNGTSLDGLLRLPDTPAGGGFEDIDTASNTPTIIVPGLLGNSVRSLVAPLVCARERLAVKGYRTEIAWVSGRAGCDHNAETLRQRILERAEHYGVPLNLIGYSKGCTDLMHMLANYPETHNAVRALVSLGGVVHGTPLADSVTRWVDWFLRYLPLPGEAVGDGLAISDLRTTYRRQWLAQNPLPKSIRYGSVIAQPDPEQISRILKASWRKLNEFSARNDSQVIGRDALLPNSELLAIVNADHWAIALPLSERHPSLTPLLNRNVFPRTTMLQGIIDWLG